MRKHNFSLSEPFAEEFDRETVRLQELKRELLGDDRPPSKSLAEVKLEHLKLHQFEYIAFLESCIEGEPDLDFLNLKYSIFMEQNLDDQGFRASSDPWKPVPVYRSSSFKTIEQAIAFYGLLKPFLEDNGHIFSRVKRCEQCQKFFIYERSDAKFCRSKCRNDHHRRRYKLQRNKL